MLMIKHYSLKALEKAINRVLILDEEAPAKVAGLHGKTLELIVRPLNVNFFISFEGGGLLLLDQYAGTPDTIIHSSPLGLIRLSILPASKARSLFNDKVRMSGDIELGQAVKELFDGLDIDWEGHLANFTGDVCAYQIGSILRHAKGFQEKIHRALGQDAREYVQEELRLFPGREELDDFFADVDEVALKVERLDAQIQLIRAAYENH